MVLRKSTYNIFLLMFVSPKHSQFQKKCANQNTSAPARWSQFNFCRSLALWPRVEQRKWILAKKIIIIKNRITKKTNRQEESPEETKKVRKNKKNTKIKKIKKNKTCIFRSFFCFSCFFPWFWFSSLFFLVALFFLYIFPVKPYILCVVGLITLATQDFPSLI